MLLNFEERNFSLKDVPESGIWVSLQSTSTNHRAFRLSINTKRHYELKIVIRLNGNSISEKDKLTDLWDSLKLNNFISTDTPLPTFKKIFSGTEINNPVKWKGKISELYYFIKLIYTDFKLVENLKQKQWQVTCICFVNENGEPFSRSQFRSLKRPNLTGDKIDKAVNLLK